MAGLGLWVMKEANEATTVAMTQVRGELCPNVPVLSDTATDATGEAPMKLDEPTPVEAGGDTAAPAPAPTAPRLAPSAVDPIHVAKHNADTAIMTVANLWCAGEGISCTPGQAEPLVIKAPSCGTYVQKKMQDAAAV